MKKWLILEILFLTVVIVVAVGVCTNLPAAAPGFHPETPTQESSTADTSQTPQTPQTPQIPQMPEWVDDLADRKLTCQQAFVYDCKTESFSFLLGKETDRVYPASITKLFTAHVALQFLQPQQQITAGAVLDLVGAGSSVADIEKGEVLTVEMLVEAMLLPSGNDAAYLLADAAGKVIKGDDTLSPSAAVAAFLKEMNGQARALGMSGTHFTNPDGYHDPNHYTTFADMVKMGKKALENQTIMQYTTVSKDDPVLVSGQTKQWKNTNALINPESPYYCPIATGLKTGQTPSAGSCLLSSFAYEGGQWLIGVFGCPQIEDRFVDTLQLLNQTLQ